MSIINAYMSIIVSRTPSTS